MIAIKNADGTLVPIAEGLAGERRMVPLSLVHSNQKRAEIQLFEIEAGDPDEHPAIVPGQKRFAVLTLRKLPDNPFGEAEIRATISVDDDSMVHILAEADGIKPVSAEFRLPSPPGGNAGPAPDLADDLFDIGGADGLPPPEEDWDLEVGTPLPDADVVPAGGAAEAEAPAGADGLTLDDDFFGSLSGDEPASLAGEDAADGDLQLDSLFDEPPGLPADRLSAEEGLDGAAVLDGGADALAGGAALADTGADELQFDGQFDDGPEPAAGSQEPEDDLLGLDGLDGAPESGGLALPPAADDQGLTLDDDFFGAAPDGGAGELQFDGLFDEAPGSAADALATGEDSLGTDGVDDDAALDLDAETPVPAAHGDAFIDDPDDTDWGFDELADPADEQLAAPAPDNGDSWDGLDFGDSPQETPPVKSGRPARPEPSARSHLDLDDDSLELDDSGSLDDGSFGLSDDDSLAAAKDDRGDYDAAGDDGFAQPGREAASPAARPAPKAARTRREARGEGAGSPLVGRLMRASIVLFGISILELGLFLALRFKIFP